MERKCIATSRTYIYVNIFAAFYPLFYDLLISVPNFPECQVWLNLICQFQGFYFGFEEQFCKHGLVCFILMICTVSCFNCVAVARYTFSGNIIISSFYYTIALNLLYRNIENWRISFLLSKRIMIDQPLLTKNAFRDYPTPSW